MKARKLGLLILILGFGGVVETAWQARAHVSLGPEGCRVLTGRFQGPSFTFEAQDRRDGLAAETSLEVENAFGDVSVTRGEPGVLRLTLRKVVYQPDEARARAFADSLRASVSVDGARVRVATNRREMEQRSDDVGFETHLSLVVPPGTAVKVQSEHGRVDVEDARSADVSASYESVRVERVAGAASINSRHGSVTARGIQGTLDLQSRYGDVEIEDVTGKSTLGVEHGDLRARRTGTLLLKLQQGNLEADDVGGDLEVDGSRAGVTARGVRGAARVETSQRDVRLERVAGATKVRSDHGALSASELGGTLVARVRFADVRADGVSGFVDLELEHGGFQGKSLRQGARVKGSGDDVVIEGFRGALEINVERGGIRLVPEGALSDAVTATASNGGVSLELPAGSRCDIEASSERGEVSVDVPELRASDSGATRFKGQVGGGGAAVKLLARHGDVSVRPGPGAAGGR
jgi:DUF4097 and DUF4098 domain-containing protein YvlB